jgi:NitT/TauT family transport system permease protein
MRGLKRAMIGRLRLIRSVLGVVVGGLIFLGLWQLVVVVGDYKEYLLPGPWTVFRRFVTAWTDGTMGPHALATVQEIVLGFIAGAATGLLVGYLLARSRIVNLVLSPYLVAAQSTPVLALAPLLILWFGPGLLSKVIICGLIVFFPVAISTLVGLRTVDAGLLELGRSLRASRRQVLTTLEIPVALPSIMGGIRVGVTLAVVGAIVGEWASVDKGLGALILLAQGSLFDIPLMFAALMTVAIIGVGLYGITVLVERRVTGDRG